MAIIDEISEYLQKGRAKNVKALVQQAIDEGEDVKVILNDGLLAGMCFRSERRRKFVSRFWSVWTFSPRTAAIFSTRFTIFRRTRRSPISSRW